MQNQLAPNGLPYDFEFLDAPPAEYLTLSWVPSDPPGLLKISKSMGTQLPPVEAISQPRQG
jgi:hypothetical protein